MTCIKNELRIVRGNAFAVRMTIEARRLDGTVIEDFDLSQAEATLNVLHAGKKTASTFTVTGNDATIAFNGTQGLGWYGLEMAGTYQGSPWRWCVDEIFQIVETNAKANVPSWTILADTTYLVDGVLTIASAADAVQADWNETNPQSAAYIKNKPAVVSPTQLQQAVNAEKERAEAAERANADAIGAEETRAKTAEQANANAIAAKYTKPSGGIPSTDMTEAVQTSLQKADNAAPQSTTYTKDEVQQLIAPKVNEAQEKTWAQLKQLRDDNELMPGQWYRIIDFVTTINTSMYDQMRSAGHAFDIMVMALTPSTLCETAFAIQHAGDTYFIGSRLQAWKLKYNIDNVDWSAQAGTYAADNNGYRFHKEGTIDIGGVTYILWKGNQAYYDDWNWYAVSLNEEVGTDMLCYYPDDDPENFDVTGQIESVTTSTVNGKGTILSMCDEHNVEHTYDFKNIQFKRWKVTDDLNRSSFNGKYLGIVNRLPDHLTIEDESDFIWAYTYAVYDYNEDTGDTTDNSLSGNVEKVTSTVSVSNNVVCVWDTENTYTVYGLSITGSVTDTTFSGDVRTSTFSGYVNNNTFSGSVSNSTFSGDVQNCTFSGSVSNNTFSGYVNNNTFSGYVNNNTFSGELYNSTFSGNLTNSMITGQFYGNTITASGSNTGTMNNIYTYGYIVNKTITVPNSSYMPTYVAMNTSNVLKVWNPADLVS